MENINVGLFGLNFCSTNLGCSALAYSFLNILFEAVEKTDKKLNVTFFDSVNTGLNSVPKVTHPRISFDIFKYDKHNISALNHRIKREHIIFDFTAGDSFSDYYGMSRFIKRTFNKTLVLLNHKKFILGPQTYGPFCSKIARIWAGYVIGHADFVYARDGLSYNRAHELCKKKDIKLVTDVAFALGYDNAKYEGIRRTDKINIGLNFSGLLYTGGYTGDNQFGLTVDYKAYCEGVLDYLTRTDKYNIWLISHVTSEKKGNNDNDLIASSELENKYNSVQVAPIFETPMDAKSFISHMDIFSGARMHATIAAFSSNVVTIPFSYSVKFEGLYGELEYPYCIHGKEYGTDEAISKTIDYIENYKVLHEEQQKSLAIAQQKLSVFSSEVEKLIQEID